MFWPPTNYSHSISGYLLPHYIHAEWLAIPRTYPALIHTTGSAGIHLPSNFTWLVHLDPSRSNPAPPDWTSSVSENPCSSAQPGLMLCLCQTLALNQTPLQLLVYICCPHNTIVPIGQYTVKGPSVLPDHFSPFCPNLVPMEYITRLLCHLISASKDGKEEGERNWGIFSSPWGYYLTTATCSLKI